MFEHRLRRGGDLAESREEMMVEALSDLLEENGVEAAVLISSDAMPLASQMPEDMPEELLSVCAASLLGSGEKVARELSRGRIDQVWLRCEEGDLVVVKVNDDALLACTVEPDAKMGMTLLVVGRCARKLASII